jgi:tRNA nucleotidyltransferase (CCA-adding enzyme)
MKKINLAKKIREQLPAEAMDTLSKAEKLAHSTGERLYLVGGVVRDLLMERSVFDIDLVLEGNAITFAEELKKEINAGLTLHKPFLTATLEWQNFNIDLTTARNESYTRPGALPTVRPGNLKDDLFRRDFSINSMAVSLAEENYGQLIDLYGGLDDLNNKLVRILHEKSFEDDATRIWRAVRYEQRLDFSMEEKTLASLRQSLPMLKTVSGDRIWYELECVFREAMPEKVFLRAEGLGVLKYLHPQLSIDSHLAKWFGQARSMNKTSPPSAGLYLALLTYGMRETGSVDLSRYLNLNRATAQTLRDSLKIKALREELSEEPMQPSAIYLHLNGFTEDALTANMIAAEPGAVRRNIKMYLDELRYVKTSLTGEDLIALGIKKGPQIKLLLGFLLEAPRGRATPPPPQDEIRLLKQFN